MLLFVVFILLTSSVTAEHIWHNHWMCFLLVCLSCGSICKRSVHPSTTWVSYLRARTLCVELILSLTETHFGAHQSKKTIGHWIGINWFQLDFQKDWLGINQFWLYFQWNWLDTLTYPSRTSNGTEWTLNLTNWTHWLQRYTEQDVHLDRLTQLCPNWTWSESNWTNTNAAVFSEWLTVIFHMAISMTRVMIIQFEKCWFIFNYYFNLSNNNFGLC